MRDPPSFQDDGNPTWETWQMDMKFELKSEPDWEEDEKMGYVLSRADKQP